VEGMQQNRGRVADGSAGRHPLPGRGRQLVPPEKIKDLAVENPAAARQHIGEVLYGYAMEYSSANGQQVGPLAGKITGMLLEGLDMSELLHLVESRDAARVKIEEALQTLMEAGRV
jgi:hypothetical protein